MSRILVAGIGNVFMGDDGFGVVAAERLAAAAGDLPDGVVVADYGIRGVHLAHDLCQGYDALVLIDAMPLGDEPPGTVAVFEPELEPAANDEPGGDAGSGDRLTIGMDGHTASAVSALNTLAKLGGTVDRTLVVGCQPATIEEGMGLSEPVAAAVDRAVVVVRELLTEMLGEGSFQSNRPYGRKTSR